MVHLLILRYTAPVDEVAPHVSAHEAHLDRWHGEGTFLVSGQSVPDDLGGAIVAIGERSAVEAIAAADPFVKAGVARYEIVSIEAGRVHPDLVGLVAPSSPEEIGWDEAALRSLRAREQDLAVLLEGRPLRPMLQHVGDSLVDAVRSRPDLQTYARQCVAELQDRFWVGDEALALELLVALGDDVRPDQNRWPWTWPLRPVPVDLGDLAEALDGDPGQEPGSLDLETGEIWPPGFDRSLIDDRAEDDEVDPDRFVYIQAESDEARRDMRDFALRVADDPLAARLLDALEGGRGAFRRFRDAISVAGDACRTRWSMFREERALGRARDWLASEGYVSSGSPGRS
jgi:uncharacterized protein YciI